MTEQNQNKEGQRKSWDELRQSILEIDASPYESYTSDFSGEAVADFLLDEQDLEQTEKLYETEPIEEKKKPSTAVNREAGAQRKTNNLQQNLIKTAVCAVALVCTVGVLKGVTGVAHHAYAKQQSHTAKASISANVVQAVKAAQQKEAEALAQEEAKKAEEAKPVIPKEYTVCVDAGHGGKDIGCNTGKREESKDALQLALLLKEQLEADGVTVIMTRETDEFLTLEQRVTTANSAKADYFVSLHRNQGDGVGVETWISSQPSEEAKTLGENIHAGITEVGVQRDRGLKQGSQSGAGNYYVIRCSDMPACIIELGFVNDDTDNKNFDEKCEEYAKAIAQGIEETAVTYNRDKSQEKTTETDDNDTSKDSAEDSTESSDTKSKEVSTAGSEASEVTTTPSTTKKTTMDALDGKKTSGVKAVTTDNLKKAQ